MIADAALDSALEWVRANGTHLSICTVDPTTYAGMVANELGKKSSISIGAPQDGSTGRKVVVAPITDGDVSATGSAAYWAVHNNVDTLVAAGALEEDTVYSGNQFTTQSIDILVTDAMIIPI